MSDKHSILEDLAAGRIDIAEAGQRLDALQTPSTDQPPTDQPPTDAEEPTPEPHHADSDGQTPDDDRPQWAKYARDDFRRPEHEVDDAEVVEEVPADDQERIVDEPIIEEPEFESPRPAGSKGVDKVVVRAVGRRVRIIGDTSVATLSASGPHVLRRSGKTLEVTSDGDIGPSFGSFSIIRPPRSVDDLRTMATGKELVIKVNPNIPVDVEVTAGGLHTSKVPVLGKVRVTAGGATLNDVVEVTDALVQAGSATVRGDLKQGRSRVRVESGNLTIVLGKDANVAVRAETQLGRVSWPGEQTGSVDEYVVGNGAARLDIGVVMGYASVREHEQTGQA
ncbi:hypothetical protein ACQB6R_03530 [Propionibacteriaceae bacterium G1746]|uniref:hypothetical protein n=1 Tax=Aestuariimicrobium sp. G57 TaxID=3418485 RepID=UPI003C2459B5